ncbi:MAG: hypothetical protein IJJ80_10585 [Clostridia bacterium]|nr:hypothetical protein [Clostridia bacterium]
MNVPAETQTLSPSSPTAILLIIITLAVMVLIPVLIIRSIKKKIRAKKNQKDEQYQQLEESHKRWIDTLNQKLHADGFNVSGERWCNDLRAEEPIRGTGKRQVVWLTSKAFLMDNKNRRMAFVLLGDTPKIDYINYDDVISCEVLYDGVKKTNTTRVIQGTNVGKTRAYTANNYSTSKDYVNSLGIKLMLRNPNNPTYVMPLITRQFEETESFAKNCEKFAQEVNDSIYAIING